MKNVMRRPFALERIDGPVPYKAIRMLLPDDSQLSLEIILAYLEGRLELDVVG